MSSNVVYLTFSPVQEIPRPLDASPDDKFKVVTLDAGTYLCFGNGGTVLVIKVGVILDRYLHAINSHEGAIFATLRLVNVNEVEVDCATDGIASGRYKLSDLDVIGVVKEMHLGGIGGPRVIFLEEAPQPQEYELPLLRSVNYPQTV